MDELKTEVGTALEEAYLLIFLKAQQKENCDRSPFATQFEEEHSLWPSSRTQFSHVE